MTANGSRATSPSLNGTSERKRRRKVLSCYDCRRRKLQCDRSLPACGRCVKSGYAADCLYLEDATDAPLREPTTTEKPDLLPTASDPQVCGDQAPTRGDTGTSIQCRLEEQQRRIQTLEAALGRQKKAVASSTAEEDQFLKNCICPPSPESETAMHRTATGQTEGDDAVVIRGSSFKTQFHGPTHPGALIPFIPDLHRFSMEIFQEFPGLSKIRQELRRFEHPTREMITQRVTDAELRTMLPSRQETDHLVNLYLESYGQIYHILHLPTFWEQYEELWVGRMSFDAHFVALVLLLTAAAQCLADTQPWLYSAEESPARDKADRAILAVESWLAVQSQKHVTATDFQIRVLLVIAKQASARKFKRTWTEAGMLLRFCMSAGLHRDPDTLRHPPSLLDRELRQRIWAAVIELELQISFDRGMVPAPWPAQSDCPPPSSLPDVELTPSNRHQHPTSAAPAPYLHLSYRSLPLRHALTTRLNSLSPALTFADVKIFSEALHSALPSPHLPGSTTPRLTQAMLELTIRQHLLALSEKFLYQTSPSSSSSSSSSSPPASRLERAFVCTSLFDNATAIMAVHASLRESGILALEILRSDGLRAALAVCHVASLVERPLSPISGGGDLIGDASLRAAVAEAGGKVITAAVEMVTDKVMRLGREQRQLWVLLAARGFLEARREPARRRAIMAAVVEGVSRPYYRRLAAEKRGAMEAGMKDVGDILSIPMEIDQVAGSGEAFVMNVEEMAAWTFEDWGFGAEGAIAGWDGEMWTG